MANRLLKRLTPDQRWAALQKERGATRAEMARIRGVSEQSIKKMLARIRRQLLASLPENERRAYAANCVEVPRRPVRAAQLSSIRSMS